MDLGWTRNETRASLLKTAHWTAKGKRRLGRPKANYMRTVEAEMKSTRVSWGQVGGRSRRVEEIVAVLY